MKLTLFKTYILKDTLLNKSDSEKSFKMKKHEMTLITLSALTICDVYTWSGWF